jgi:hypothetical protein
MTMSKPPATARRAQRPAAVMLIIAVAAATGCSERRPAPASAAASGGDSVADRGRTAAAPGSAAESLPPVEPGFVRLVLDDFDVFQPKAPKETRSWTAQGATIVCTGKPRGYLFTKQPHADFTLRAELRYPGGASEAEQGNTGILVHIAAPHRVWPVCLEVQGKYVEMAAIKGNGKPNPLDAKQVHDHEPARRQARKPAGEWNSLEVVSRDGRLVSRLNGAVICESEPGSLRAGPIGLQAEDRPYEIRNLRIRDDSPR